MPSGKNKRSRTPLHPEVKNVVSKYQNCLQVCLRWISVLASSLVAVQVGKGIDLDGQLPTSWWISTLALILLAVLSGAAALGHSLLTQSTTEKKLRQLTQQAWFKLGPYRVRERTGKLLDMVTNGAMRAARYRGGFLSASLASLSAPLIVCLVMGLFINWAAAGSMVLLVIIGPFLLEIFNRSTKTAGDRFRISQTHLRQSFLQGINALESLIYAGAGNAYAEELAKGNEQHRRRIMRLLAGNQSLIFFMDVIFSLAAFVLATFIGTNGVSNGTLTSGQAISLIILTVLMVAPVDLIGQFFYIGIGGRATQRQFSSLLYETENVRSKPKQNRLEKSMGSNSMIELDEVTGGWNQDLPLLTNVSLRISPGERVALIGPSGIGKSTLLAIIQGQLEVQDGRANVGGQSVIEVDPSPNMAVVEQRTYLFNGTIAENLLLADPEASEDELWQSLERANLAEEIRQLPAKLNTEVGDRGSRLSGGQAQRLSLARAFLKNASILILDEPTSQVDLAGEANILQAIENISIDRTVLMVAHRSAALSHVDRVLEIRDQKVVDTDE